MLTISTNQKYNTQRKTTYTHIYSNIQKKNIYVGIYLFTRISKRSENEMKAAIETETPFKGSLMRCN